MSRLSSMSVHNVHVDRSVHGAPISRDVFAFSHDAQHTRFASSDHGHHFFGRAVSTPSNIPMFTNRYKPENSTSTSPEPAATPSPPPPCCHNTLPAYQSRHNEMLCVLREFETRPSTLVAGFIRGINTYAALVPQDIITLCFKFLQHSDLATLIDSKDHDELYALAWEATENREYLFAEQIIAYLLRTKHQTQMQTQTQTAFHFNFANPNLQIKNLNTSPLESRLESQSPMSLTRTPRTPTPRKDTTPRKRSSTDSSDASAHNLMAVIQYFLGDFSASEAYFARAAAMDPQCDVIMNNYAVLLLEQQRYTDAEAQMERAIRAAPRCLANRQQYAYILFSVGKLQAAARQCRLMVRMAPTVESHSGYAWLLEQMGRVEESEAQYRKLIDLEPDNAIWWFWHALLLVRCGPGKYTQARTALEECLRLDGSYEGARAHYAYVLLLCGEVERAREEARRVIGGADGDGHVCVHLYCALVMMHEGEGRSEQTAVNELMRCLEILEGSEGSACRNEKGCVRIDERHVRALLERLGYGQGQ